MRISVFGLGYVGCVTAACFAKLGHNIIGVDMVDYKLDAINNGEAPIEEKGLKDLMQEQFKKGRIKATKNVREAILNSEISFVCVGTPPKKDGSLDLSALERVCEDIGKALVEKKYHLIVIRSTIFPGSFEILTKIIEKNSRKKYKRDFDLVVNPEFLREGSAIKDFFNPPFIILGSDNKDACKKASLPYKGIKSKIFIVMPELAQMIKYANNSWHALKVTFVNEIGSVCKEIGIDARKLMDLFCEDYQLNLSSYYLKPGFAYGGSCLPKDLAALKINAEELGMDIPLISSISPSNMAQIERAINLIESKGKKKIGVLGLTFKADTDDIRGNPILFIVNRLINKGYNIKIFDRLIDESDIENISLSYRKEVFDLVNREDLKERVGGISTLFADLDTVLHQDVIVVSNRDFSLKEYLKTLQSSKIIIDLQNLFNQEDFAAKYDHL